MLFGNKPKRDDNVQKRQPKPTRKEQRMLRKQAKIEAKRQRKLDRKERSKVRKIGQWMKNLGKSSTDIFLDWFTKQNLVTIADGEIRYIKDLAKEHLANNGGKVKIQPVKSVINYSKEQINELMEKLEEAYQEDNGGSLKEDFIGHVKALGRAVKTGNLNEKHGTDMMDDEDIAFLFDNMDDWDDLEEESYGENYKIEGGYIMNIKGLKEEAIKRIRISASGESLSVVAPLTKLNERLESIKYKIIAYSEDCDKFECDDEFVNTSLDNKYSDLKDEITGILNVVSTDGKLEKMYQEPVADLIVAAVATHTDRKIDEGVSKSEIEKDIDDAVEELEDKGVEVIKDSVEDRISDIEESITDADDKTFHPVVNEIAENELDAYASLGEMLGKSESASFAEDAGLLAGVGSIMDLFQLFFALPINVVNSRKVEATQAKYGSNFVAKQPMVVSSTMSKELAGKYSKALEIKYLLETKAVLEATAAKADGGLVTSRTNTSGVVKYLTPNNIKFKDAKLYDNKQLDYNEIIGVFSENKNPLGKTSTDVTFLLPSIRAIAERYEMEYDLMNSISSYMIPSGEAGDFINHGRDALPSYIEVSIEYVASKNVTNFNVENKMRTSMIGVQILPRSINNIDIVDTIADMDASRLKAIKVDKDERNFIKKMRNLVKFWRRKGTKDELKVLKSNSFADIVKKIESISTPLFHLVITMDEYVMLKNQHKVDIMSGSTYSEMMRSLPLISISIVDEDTNKVYFSEGPVMNFYHHDIDAYIDSLSQYEKDLKTIIKYNQYR